MSTMKLTGLVNYFQHGEVFFSLRWHSVPMNLFYSLKNYSILPSQPKKLWGPLANTQLHNSGWSTQNPNLVKQRWWQSQTPTTPGEKKHLNKTLSVAKTSQQIWYLLACEPSRSTLPVAATGEDSCGTPGQLQWGSQMLGLVGQHAEVLRPGYTSARSFCLNPVWTAVDQNMAQLWEYNTVLNIFIIISRYLH